MDGATWYGPSPMDRPRPEPKAGDWYKLPEMPIGLLPTAGGLQAEVIAVLRLCLTVVRKTKAKHPELIARIEQLIRLMGGGA